MTGQNRGVQQRLGRVFFLSIALAAATAQAEKKTVLVSAGDCADPTLITAARELREASAAVLGGQLVEGEVVLDIVRPRATRTVAELDRQLDSARTLFYGGQGARALEQVARVLEELERIGPDQNPWATTTTALVLKALIARSADKPKDASDAFRQIARIDPTFKLDPDAFPPSVISAFEAVKKELARTRKTMVLLRADSGEAMVFVDGRAMGSSPLKLELVPGSYRVSMMQSSTSSFAHRLEVPRDTKVSVDLEFERSVGAQLPLCLSSSSDEGALKLAQLVAAERVVVLRNTARRGEPLVPRGVVFDVATGQKERERSGVAGQVLALATFLLTGREVAPPAPAVSATAKTPAPSPTVEAPREAPVVLAPTQIAPSGVSGARVASFVLIGAGAASIAAGVVAFASLGADRDRYLAITPMGALPAVGTSARDEALLLAGRLDGNAQVSLILVGAGVGAAAAGVIGLVLFPSSPVQVSAAVTPGEGALFVRGSF